MTAALKNWGNVWANVYREHIQEAWGLVRDKKYIFQKRSLLTVNVDGLQGEKDFFARSCLPFWSFLSAFENSKETSDSLSSLKKVNSSHKDLLKIQLPLSSKEVIEILGKPPGPELGKVLDQLRRKFLNGKLQTPEEMRAYLNSKKWDSF